MYICHNTLRNFAKIVLFLVKHNKITSLRLKYEYPIADTAKKIILVIISGPASAPTALSVVWDPPSAVVSFQSPVYGGDCVDYYVVTAVSEEEERNVSCTATTDGLKYNCSIDGDVNNYNFTAYAVTPVNDSFSYSGSITTDCSKFCVYFTTLKN